MYVYIMAIFQRFCFAFALQYNWLHHIPPKNTSIKEPLDVLGLFLQWIKGKVQRKECSQWKHLTDDGRQKCVCMYACLYESMDGLPPLQSMYTKSMASCHCGLPDLDCNKIFSFFLDYKKTVTTKATSSFVDLVLVSRIMINIYTFIFQNNKNNITLLCVMDHFYFWINDKEKQKELPYTEKQLNSLQNVNNIIFRMHRRKIVIVIPANFSVEYYSGVYILLDIWIRRRQNIAKCNKIVTIIEFYNRKLLEVLLLSLSNGGGTILNHLYVI